MALAACSGGDAPLAPTPTPAAAPARPAADHADERAALAAYEASRRAAAAWASLPPASAVLGADPYRIAALPGKVERIGIERGRGEVVLLDEGGAVLDRMAAPPRPTALAIGADGAIYVGGASPTIAILRMADDGGRRRLVRAGETGHPALGAIRALAVGPEDALYAADDEAGVVAGWRPGDAGPTWSARCRAPIELVRSGRFLVVDCLVDHAVTAWEVDGRGLPREAVATIAHDGPIWSVAAVDERDALWLALGGVEDHPLERSDGTFGYVDSFLFLYRIDGRVGGRTGGRLDGQAAAGVAGADGRATRTAAVNLGELGVITPKWVGLRAGPAGGLVATATGYGGDRLVELSWPAIRGGPPAIATRPVPPGIAALVPGEGGRPGLAANPLLDAWMVVGDDDVVLHRAAPAADAPTRSAESRVGEALAFTRLLSPWAPTDGKASRFTCETCHFEGGIDGRTHFTGRGAVHATTKPLMGLFANRPHFTRALDRSMADMVDNEFRVATRSSGRDPWFSVGKDELPWLADLEGAPATLDPVYLRRALMAFLMDFNHEPNRATVGREAFDERERRGATLFRDRCAGCHAPRLVVDRPDSEVPFERWEASVLGAGAIAWARDGHEATGVEPYVHDDGARPTSLRRLARKQPYFTDGSARTLDDVLERAAWVGDRFFHDRAPADAGRLTADERRALRAFLDLL